MSLISALGGWAWMIVAAILVALDIAVPGLYLVWFGLGAAATGALFFAAGGLALEWQLIAFAGFALAFLGIGRGMFAPGRIKSENPTLNLRTAQLVGRSFTLDQPISGGRGRLTIGDTIWMATGPDLPAGARVTVTGADGAVLIVASAEPPKPDLPKAGHFGAS